MITTHSSTLQRLVESHLGRRRAAPLFEALELPPALLGSGPLSRAPDQHRVQRSQLAAALALVLFDGVCQRVPMAAAYVGDAVRAGRRLVFDHGALRTVGAPSGELPAGREAFARFLEPLGYALAGVYPLERLGMTGFVYAHRDLPEEIPQYFVSELHPEGFSPRFQLAAARVVSTGRDPLPSWSAELLAELAERGELDFARAADLLPCLVACFDRQHSEPRLDDYLTLAAESPEMAWIATEGNAFNHATDRVADVRAVAAAQHALGRPMKPTLEVSRSGRVVQTAFRAAAVERLFLDADDRLVTRTVPGSFHEFISRERMPDGRLDLAFDAQNAQGIFKMTDLQETRA